MTKMNICPACGSVHEAGGVCSSRCGSTFSIIFDIPATASGKDNPLESRCGTIQQLIAANDTRKRGKVPRPLPGRSLRGQDRAMQPMECFDSSVWKGLITMVRNGGTNEEHVKMFLKKRAIKKKVERIYDLCDGSLSHPNVLELEDNPDATSDDFRHAIGILTKALEDIMELSGQIFSET
jgi:hypothetical protein